MNLVSLYVSSPLLGVREELLLIYQSVLLVVNRISRELLYRSQPPQEDNEIMKNEAITNRQFIGPVLPRAPQRNSNLVHRTASTGTIHFTFCTLKFFVSFEL
jgi:hypothetical protein